MSFSVFLCSQHPVISAAAFMSRSAEGVGHITVVSSSFFFFLSANTLLWSRNKAAGIDWNLQRLKNGHKSCLKRPPEVLILSWGLFKGKDFLSCVLLHSGWWIYLLFWWIFCLILQRENVHISLFSQTNGKPQQTETLLSCNATTTTALMGVVPGVESLDVICDSVPAVCLHRTVAVNHRTVTWRQPPHGAAGQESARYHCRVLLSLYSLDTVHLLWLKSAD